MEKIGYIYKITNPKGRIYIGKTTRLNDRISSYRNNHKSGQKIIERSIEKYGWDHFDLNKHSLQEIMEGHHLDRVFTDTWTKPSCKEGKMAYCANICGTYSRVDRIYTHDKMDDKSRNWREIKVSK